MTLLYSTFIAVAFFAQALADKSLELVAYGCLIGAIGHIPLVLELLSQPDDNDKTD